MPMWQFELLVWGISSGFPLVNHFNLSIKLPSYLHFSILVCVHASACTYFLARPMGRRSLSITPSFELHEPFCTYVQEKSPDFEIGKYVVSYLYLGRAQCLLSIVLLLKFWRLRPQGMNLELSHSGGFTYLLPQLQIPRCVTALLLFT